MKTKSKKEYTAPKLITLGNVQGLTQNFDRHGSGPVFVFPLPFK